MHAHLDAAELRRRFLESVPPSVRDAIQRLLAASRADIYAVGGVVRDLLLGRPVRDVDLMAAEDAIELAQRAFPGASLTTHQRFHTVALELDGAFLDIATARRETYARSGALPAVAIPGTIDDDLRRRDFTVNAMALTLAGEPGLLDPTGGLNDLHDSLIRTLHAGSFRDDATRIFRALRYASRLRFSIEKTTADAMRDGVRFISTISGARLRRELELMMNEGGDALEAAATIGALRAIDPDLTWDSNRTACLALARTHHLPAPAVGFALLSSSANTEGMERITHRLRLRREEHAAAAALPAIRVLEPMLRRPEAKPSGIVLLLDRFPSAAVLAFAGSSADPIAAGIALRYLGEWRHVRPVLGGNDLLAVGVPAGPQVQRGLQLIRAARLDGWAAGEGEERALALRFAHSIRESVAPRET